MLESLTTAQGAIIAVITTSLVSTVITFWQQRHMSKQEEKRHERTMELANKQHEKTIDLANKEHKKSVLHNRNIIRTAFIAELKVNIIYLEKFIERMNSDSAVVNKWLFDIYDNYLGDLGTLTEDEVFHIFATYESIKALFTITEAVGLHQKHNVYLIESDLKKDVGKVHSDAMHSCSRLNQIFKDLSN